jgi:hypothetical protein
MVYKQREVFGYTFVYFQFNIFSNDFASSCVLNRPISLCFERVRSVSIFAKEISLTLETFEFVQTAFPNVKTLCLTSELQEIDSAYYSASGIKQPGLFSNDFLSNTTIQLLSVTELYAVLDLDHYDNKTLCCLFHLLPNLITLRTNCLEFLLRHIESPDYYDDFVMYSLNRINLEFQ